MTTTQNAAMMNQAFTDQSAATTENHINRIAVQEDNPALALPRKVTATPDSSVMTQNNFPGASSIDGASSKYNYMMEASL